MDNINFEENLSQIKMAKSKAAAQALNENWNTGNSFHTAGTYRDGAANEIKNISNISHGNLKPSFSFGLLETVFALNNTAFTELKEAKMLLDKYINHITIKGISEAYLIESLINDLKSFSWETNAKNAISNLTETYKNRIKEIEVAKSIEQINASAGRDMFSGIVESMKAWLSSDEKITEKLVTDLKKWGFNSTVKGLIEKLYLLEGKSDKQYTISVNSNNCDVKKLIAPCLVYESAVVFTTGNRFFKAEDGEISLLERNDAAKLPKEFLSAALLLSHPNIRLNESGLDFYVDKKKVSIVLENETGLKTITVDGIKMSNERLGFMLAMELRNSIHYNPKVVDDILTLTEAVEYLADVDFGKKIKSKVYEGVEANVFKYGKKAYIQKVNPSMRKNELLECNGSQAVNEVKEFLGFDISESMLELLEKEDKVLIILKNDKDQINKNIQLIENEQVKLKKAIETNPALQESEEIKAAQDVLESESEKLKAKWNQINVEIDRFQKGKKTIGNISEREGYPINTDIKVRRSGERGKVFAVNGNSKTYTVMFENGSTGEFFFGDVIDLNDEVSASNLTMANEKQNPNFAKAPDRNGKKSGKFIQDTKIMNLSKAPEKTAKGSGKFIENTKDMNLGKLSFGSGRKAKETKGVSGDMNLGTLKVGSGRKPKETKGVSGDMNLGKLPKTSSKGGGKFIDNLSNMNLAESQTNKAIEKAPVGKKPTQPKKFIEPLKNAKLATAKGDHSKNGRKFHEPLKNQELAKAPVSKKR